MGLFDLFGKSFDQQVQEAINDVGATTPGVSGLRADVRGKVITLNGNAESREAANLAMQKITRRSRLTTLSTPSRLPRRLSRNRPRSRNPSPQSGSTR